MSSLLTILQFFNTHFILSWNEIYKGYNNHVDLWTVTNNTLCFYSILQVFCAFSSDWKSCFSFQCMKNSIPFRFSFNIHSYEENWVYVSLYICVFIQYLQPFCLPLCSPCKHLLFVWCNAWYWLDQDIRFFSHFF